jgi:DNA-binding NtrC family response regulator
MLCAARLDSDRLALVERIRSIDHSCPVLILTQPVSAECALDAMRAGASDILDWNAPTDAIAAALQRLSARHQAQGAQHGSEPGSLIGANRIVGQGPVIARIRRQIAKVAATDANVLITGESGTGKELVAELVHRNSRRSALPFVAVNCAAIPDALLESELFGHERGAFTGAATARDGKLQHAAGGTLFLDEIGDMSLISQAKILRAIETRVVQRLGSNLDTPVRFRVVAATNQNLETLTREKKFRPDLYFRLNVVRLDLPPLRERSEDIPALAEHIVGELSEGQNEPLRRIESDVLRRLQRHSWPGNVRELRNVIESILVYSSARSISLTDVPVHIRKTLCSHMPRADERSKILSALNSTDWNRSKASDLLHCSRMTLYRQMIKHSITDEEV